MSAPKPRTRTPDLEVPTVGGESWKLADSKAKNFTMIVAYRGYHCPICKNYLRDLDRHAAEFEKRGVEIIALSTDDKERAEKTRQEWELDHLKIGYGLDLDKAREWGLYISTSRGKTSAGIEEPPMFNEPGLYLVKPDGTLYWSNISTMPFARPHFKEILGAVDTVLERNYPARGEA